MSGSVPTLRLLQREHDGLVERQRPARLPRRRECLFAEGGAGKGDGAVILCAIDRQLGHADAFAQALSRLETSVAEADARATNAVLLDNFCDTPRRTPRTIVLGLDTSAHPTCGNAGPSFV